MSLDTLKKISTTRRIVITIGIAVFLSLVILVSLSTYLVNRSTLKSTSDFGLNMAKSISKSINTDDYQKLLDNRDDTALYDKLYTHLNKLIEATGALYVYTVESDATGKIVNAVVDGTDKTNSTHADLGDKLDTVTPDMVKEVQANGSYQSDIIDGGAEGQYITILVPILNSHNAQIGILGVDISADYIASLQHKYEFTALLYSSITAVIIFLLSIAFITVQLKRDLKPLAIMHTATQQVGDGDFTGAKKTLNSYTMALKNDMGDLYDTVKHMVDNLINILSEINKATVELNDSMPKLLKVAEDSGAAGDRIRQTMVEFVDGAQTQLQTTKEVAHGTTEMASALQRIAENTGDISEVSQESLANSQQGVASLNKTVEAVNHFKESTGNINEAVTKMITTQSSITQVLDDIKNIADQTNLLSLNASIEAARAGEHGKGFAVVAQEVRKLAEESKNATEKINNLLKAINTSGEEVIATIDTTNEIIDTGVVAVGETQQSFEIILAMNEQLDLSIQEVSAAVEQISASSEEIAASFDGISRIAEHSTKSTDIISDSIAIQDACDIRAEELVGDIGVTSERLAETVAKFK